MKRNLVIILAAFTAVATLFSCQKESTSEQKAEPSKENASAIMTVNAGEIQTKTFLEANGENYDVKWSAGDQIAAYEVGNGVIANDKKTSTALAADAASASFTIDFSGNSTLNPNYSYVFVYPASRLSKYGSPTIYEVLLPYQQVFTSTSFDKNADILISEGVTNQASRPASVDVAFERIGATALMNIKAPSTTEEINKIIFSTTEGYLAGYIEIDPAAGTHTKTIMASGAKKSIELTPASSTTFTGTIPVWFRLGAISLINNFTVSIITDDNTYSKTVDLATPGKTLAFNDSGLTKFNVDMSAIVPTPLADLSGDYLIGGKPSTTWNLMSATNGGSYFSHTATTVTKDYGALSYTDFSSELDPDDYIWTVEKTAKGYTIKSRKTDKYLALTADSNSSYATDALDDVNNSTYFSISVDGLTNVATITSKRFTSRVLKNNSGSSRFAFYTSGQSVTYLISATYDGRTKVTLSFAAPTPTYTTANYGSFTGQIATSDPNVSAVTSNITYSKTDASSVISTLNASTGAVTLSGTTGSATVTATFAGDGTYKPATASYTITVNSAMATPDWEELDSPANIVSGDTYMFVKVISSTSYYMTTETCNQGAGTTCAALTTLPTEVGFTTVDAMKLILTGNTTDGFIASNPAGKQLKIGAANDGLSFANSGTTVSFYTDENITGYILFGPDTKSPTPETRYIGTNGTTDFRCYTSVGNNVKGTYVWYHYIGG